jgi:tetratricopeptide (TPR) repeat protein
MIITASGIIDHSEKSLIDYQKSGHVSFYEEWDKATTRFAGQRDAGNRRWSEHQYLRSYIIPVIHALVAIGMWQTERKGVLLLPVLVLLALGLSAFPAGAAPLMAGDWYNEGVNYTNQGRYDGALNSFDQAITLNPDYARAYFAKGQVLATIGMHSEAIVAYEMATARDPGLAAVVENYLVTSEKVL